MRADIATVSLAVAGAAHEAATGTERIQETGRSFATIFGLVEQQAEANEIITTMMEQVSPSAFGIAETMQALSNKTQHNSERTRQVAREMQHLATLAQHLRLSVEVFQLKQTETAIVPGEHKETDIWDNSRAVLR